MKRSAGGRKHASITQRGKLGIKGPMAHQRPSGLEGQSGARKNKGRMHWEAKAQ